MINKELQDDLNSQQHLPPYEIIVYGNDEAPSPPTDHESTTPAHCNLNRGKEDRRSPTMMVGLEPTALAPRNRQNQPTIFTFNGYTPTNSEELDEAHNSSIEHNPTNDDDCVHEVDQYFADPPQSETTGSCYLCGMENVAYEEDEKQDLSGKAPDFFTKKAKTKSECSANVMETIPIETLPTEEGTSASTETGEVPDSHVSKCCSDSSLADRDNQAGNARRASHPQMKGTTSLLDQEDVPNDDSEKTTGESLIPFAFTSDICKQLEMLGLCT